MTPTQKKYTAALGNLYKYQTNWYDFGPNPNRVLVMVMGLVKNYNRWQYSVMPLENSKEIHDWMKPEFKVDCTNFLQRAIEAKDTTNEQSSVPA